MNALLKELLIVEDGTDVSDHAPAGAEAKTLEYLRTTHRPGASIEQDTEICTIASRLFATLAQLTTCGPKIRVLGIVDVDKQVGEKENSAAQGSTRRSDIDIDIDIEKENAELAAKAEQLCREQIAVADLGQGKDIYIRPYRNAGVWHCILQTSESVLNLSVSGDRKMKVIEPPQCTTCGLRLTEIQTVHKDLRSNIVTGERDDVRTLQVVSLVSRTMLIRNLDRPARGLHSHGSSLGRDHVVYPSSLS